IMGTFFGLFNIQIPKMTKTAKPIILIHVNIPSLIPVDQTINSRASPGTLYKYQIPVIKMPGSAIAFQKPNTLKTLSCICLSFTNNLIGNATSAIAKTIAMNVRKASDGKYVGLKNAFQNDNVYVHFPGVNFAERIPVIIAAVNHEIISIPIPMHLFINLLYMCHLFTVY